MRSRQKRKTKKDYINVSEGVAGEAERKVMGYKYLERNIRGLEIVDCSGKI